MSRRSRNRKLADEAARGQPVAAAAPQAWFPAVAAAAYFAAVLFFGWLTQFYSPYVREGDELYHFHHALVYRLHGPWSSAFPWVTYSVISKFNADLWYGYHLLLIPFTLGNPVSGLKWGAVVLTAVSAAIVWSAIRMRGARLSFLWPTLFLCATGFGLSRFYTLRPGVISMALIALLLSALFADRRKLAGIVGALFAFIHLTVVWLPLMVCGVAAVMSRLLDGRWRGRAVGWTCAGLAVGALLRPNPIGAAHLLYVQTIELALAKASGAVPSDAQEMLPLGGIGLHVIGPFAALLIAATVILVVVKRGRGHASDRPRGGADADGPLGGAAGYLATTGVLTVAFGIGAICAALRCLDQFHTFGTLYLCGITTVLLDPAAQPGGAIPAAPRTRGSRVVQRIAAVVVALAFVLLGARNAFRGDPTEDLNSTKYHDAAAWLRHNTPVGAIVFHARWSDFPSLWFWDDHNQFIAGMDPIFSYVAGPGRFHEYNELRQDHVDESDIGDPYDVLKHDFGAQYVVVEPSTQPHFAQYLSNEEEAEKRFDKDGVQIFELVHTDDVVGPLR